MKFPHKAQGERDGVQLLHAEVEGAHIIVNLT